MSQATVANEYERPNGLHTPYLGGVSTLANGHWLIAWGGRSQDYQRMATISEVDPETGVTHFELVLHRDGKAIATYRAYHESEADVAITAESAVARGDSRSCVYLERGRDWLHAGRSRSGPDWGREVSG